MSNLLNLRKAFAKIPSSIELLDISNSKKGAIPRLSLHLRYDFSFSFNFEIKSCQSLDLSLANIVVQGVPLQVSYNHIYVSITCFLSWRIDFYVKLNHMQYYLHDSEIKSFFSFGKSEVIFVHFLGATSIDKIGEVRHSDEIGGEV